MIGRSFKPVGWVAGVATAALGCYMLSLQVATERAELASVERRIVAAQQNIRALQTELGTRGRLQQLERWNADVLALSAPVTGQFLDNEVRLASFDVRQRDFDGTSSNVRMASAEAAPADPVVTAPQPALAELKPKEATVPLQQPMMRRASLVVAGTSALEAPAAPVTRASSLLDEGTLRELRAASSNEREGGAGN